MEECCGANCRVASDQVAPGCTAAQTIAHGGFDVTQADTMPVQDIHHEQYEQMYNASCASGYDRHESNLTVDTKVYDCAGLCPVADYGDVIFSQCCADCASSDTSTVLGQHNLTFSLCKGCALVEKFRPYHQSLITHETEAAFQYRVNATLIAQVNHFVEGEMHPHYGESVYGSVHDGAYSTVLDPATGAYVSSAALASRHPSLGAHVDPLPLATGAAVPSRRLDTSAVPGSATGSAPLGSTVATESRELQHMFDNSFGYNTRCAAAVGQCHGTFQIKLVNCNDCMGVPILQRACCRDCGCALAQESGLQTGPVSHGNRISAGDYVHLACSGCGCGDITDSIADFASHYVLNCDPLSAEVRAQYFVHGQIPLSFQNTGVVLGNPAALTAVAAAIAEIAGLPSANLVRVSLQPARRLSPAEEERRLSGVINAVYEFPVNSTAEASRTEALIETGTTDSAQAVINHYLDAAGVPMLPALVPLLQAGISMLPLWQFTRLLPCRQLHRPPCARAQQHRSQQLSQRRQRHHRQDPGPQQS